VERLLTWHLWVTSVAARLFQLHLLWLAWSFRGGVVAGAFPATAAVHAVLRQDALAGGESTHNWRQLRACFRAAWYAEVGPANRRGYALAAVWLLLGLNRWAVDLGILGATGPALAVVLVLVTVLIGVATVQVEVLAAHFTEGAGAALRRAAVLTLARPGAAVMNALGVGVVAYAYVRVPGLVPVFGVALPAWISTQYLWSTGLLQPPGRERDASDAGEEVSRRWSTSRPRAAA
jgi:uncharacterized membrane protein YesL